MNEFFSSDRDFSEDVVKQQSMVVAQHNDLITKAKYDLTTNEIKVTLLTMGVSVLKQKINR